MNNLTERLTERLHERASDVELQFTPDDVRRAAGEDDQDEQGPAGRGRFLLAAAAALVLIGGTIAVVTRGGTGAQVETSPIAGDSTDPATTTLADRVESPEVLSIVVLDTAPTQVGPTGTVLRADQVGIVEVGPPDDELLSDQPWLAGATCVASQQAIGCGALDGQNPPGSPEGSNGATYGSNNGDGYHVTTADQRAGVVLLAAQNEGLFVAGLPAAAVEVKATIDNRSFIEAPAVGTAAFPLTPTAQNIRVVAVDKDGNLVWDSLQFDLP